MNGTSTIALVTGAGRGIGEAIARRLVADGMKVIALDKSVDGIGASDALIPCEFDLTETERLPGLVSDLAKEHGLVRVLVNNAPYDASKAGVVALTRTAAGELAPDNIRVNAIAPGVISTPGDTSVEEPLFKAAYRRQIPMDRYGTPDEIASVVSFLASDDASFMTGQTLIVDGGQIACQDNRRYMEIPGLKPSTRNAD